MTDFVLNIKGDVQKLAETAPIWKFRPILLTDKFYFLKLITDIFAAITYQSSDRLYKTLNCVYTMHKRHNVKNKIKSAMQSKRTH